MFWIFSLLLAAQAAEPEALHIFSHRGAVVWSVAGRPRPLARDAEMGADSQIVLGRNAGLSLDGEAGTRVSVLGPALFELPSSEEMELHLEYGELGVETDQAQLQVTGPDWTLKAAGRGPLNFFVELSPSGKGPRARIKNSGAPLLYRQKVQNQGSWVRIESEQVLYDRGAGERPELGPLHREEKEISEQRHYNNRHLLPLEEKLEHAPVVEKLPNQMEASLFGGISRLLGATATEPVQNLPGLGLGLSYVRRTHLTSVPKVSRRTELYAPVLRWGLELGGRGQLLKPRAETPSRQSGEILLGPRVGFGAYGFQFDAIVGAMLFGGQENQPRLPLAMGGVAAYRIDFQEITQAEAGVSLGLRYFWSPMESRAPAPSGPYQWHFLALEAALSFLF